MGGMKRYLMEIEEQNRTCFYLAELKDQPERVQGMVRDLIKDLGVCSWCGVEPPESPIVHMDQGWPVGAFGTLGGVKPILLCEDCHKEHHTEVEGVDELWSFTSDELYGDELFGYPPEGI